jgi:hypothetical protein
MKNILKQLALRIEDRIELEKHAQNAAKLVRESKNENERTLYLLALQAKMGSPLAHSALEHIEREMNAESIETDFDPKNKTTTIKYTRP